jgi:membrane fusion protein, multidrug efflux system
VTGRVAERFRALDRRKLQWAAAGGAVLLVLIFGVPWLVRAWTTVSTDDAYVNGHITLVAPRVEGQVAKVLVDDNNRVHVGDLLVQLDPEPYRVQVQVATAAVDAARAELGATQAQVRGLAGQARSQRFNLEHVSESLHKDVAELEAKVATLRSKKATLGRAQADYDRDRPLVEKGAISKGEFDAATEARSVAQAEFEKAQQDVYQVRVRLGLPSKPAPGHDLTEVPAELDQTFSTVKEAQGRLVQTAAQLGVNVPFSASPKEMLEEFYRRDPEGNIDRIYEQILKEAPAVKLAEAKLAQAEANLAQAQLDLRYCDVRAEIDGVVTRRSVNPGNHVLAGEGMLAVRSLTEIWVDANFKETQLAHLRIGQPVDLDVDMYGGSRRFQGRISGFTMGTGSTLALLPAENATGNFVKIVQRLPVRIELLDYDPEATPLFVGLSVTPYVHVNEAPTGPGAGRMLQPYLAAAEAAAATR